MSVMVKVENAQRSYMLSGVEVNALNGVSVDIEEGQFVAIVGRSGSGKSTLLNLIGGLDSPDQGRVIVDGLDLSQLPSDRLARYRRKTVGMIFQSFNLITSMTALQNVALSLTFDGVAKEEREETALKGLGALGLTDRTGHKPTELSGGEQQRVAIARALINDPRVLLADEPTGNLDSRTAEEILNLIKKLNKDHKLTVLMVTHDADAAAQYSDRIITLIDGQVGFSEV